MKNEWIQILVAGITTFQTVKADPHKRICEFKFCVETFFSGHFKQIYLFLTSRESKTERIVYIFNNIHAYPWHMRALLCEITIETQCQRSSEVFTSRKLTE